MHTIPVLDIKHFAAKCCSGAKRWVAAVACLLVLGSIPAAQAQFYFDVTSGSGLGTATGSNSWNSTIWNNNDSSGNSGREAWSNGNTVIFNAGSGTYTANITAATTVSGVTVSQGNVTISKSGSGSLAMSANSTFNVVSSLTVSAPIGGSFSLTKTGAGTLTFSGANTYSGATNIGTSGGVSGGTLALGAVDVLPGTTVNIYGGTLDLGANNDTIGALNLGGGAAATAAAVTGTGTLSLGGNLTYSATNNAQGATISSNLSLNGANRTFTIGDSTNVAAADDLTVSGVISNGSGNRGIIKTGAGTLTLTNTNTYTGNTTINAGTIKITADPNLGAAPGAPTAGKLTLGGGTLEAASSLTLSSNRGIALTSSTTSNLTADNSQTLTYGGIIAGAGNITYGTATTGTGTVLLSGNSTYTGTTAVNAGTVVVTSNNALGTNGGGTTVNSGGTLGFQGSVAYSTTEALSLTGTGAGGRSGAIDNISGTNSFAGPLSITGNTTIGATAGALTLSGTVNLSASAPANTTLTLNPAASSSLTLSGQVSDALNNSFSLGLAHTGNGTVFLSNGTNNYWGDTTIGTAGGVTTGTLSLGANALPTANSGTTLRIYSGTLDLANNSATSFGSLILGGGGGGSTAAITTGTGTLTLGGNVTFDATNNADGATISGKLALGSANRTFTINDSTAVNAANDLSVSAVVSGTGGLIKTGSGTLQLSGTNTYSGNTTVNAGTLEVSADANLGTAPGSATAGKLTLGGGSLDATSSFTLNSNRGIALTAATTSNLTADNSQTLTYGGIIAGSGNLTLGTATTGAGIVSLSGANTNSGTTTVNAGTLRAGAANTFSSSSAVTLANTSGVALDLNSFNQTIGSLAGGGAAGGNVTLGSGTLTTGGNNTSTSYAGVISGTGGLTKAGTGVFTLTGANTYGGTTNVNAGTLRAGAANTFSSSSAVALTNTSGATLDLNGFNQSIGSLTGGGVTGGNVTLGSGTLTTGGDNTSTSYAGVISGTGSVAKTGTGTQTLTGTNTYSGTTTINAGTLKVSADANLGAAPGSATPGKLTLGGGSLDATSSFTLNSNRGIALTAATTSNLTADNSQTLTYGGIIAGSGNLTLGTATTGAGIVSLSGANTNSGTTTVNAGTLRAGAANTFSSSSAVTLANTSGATLDLNSFNQTIGSLAGGGGAGGNVTLGSGTLTTGGDNTSTSYAGVISGSGGLTKAGSGTLTLSGANTYGGATAVNGGTLRAGAANTFSSSSAVTLANTSGVALDLNSFNQSIGSLAGGGTTGGNVTLGSGTLVTGGDNTSTSYAGVVSGSGGLTKAGSGTLTLTGANTYGGTTTVNAGTLRAGATNTFSSSSAVTLADVTGATLDLNNFSQTIGSLAGGGVNGGNVSLGSGTLTTGGNGGSTTYNGVISGTGGSLTKAGAGTFTLGGTNLYTGTTTLTAGTLAFGNNSALGTSGLTINGGTIQASGGARTLANNVSLGGNFTVGGTNDLTLSGTIALNGSNRTVTVNNTGLTTFSGSINQATYTGLVKEGTGSLLLSGTNLNTGPTAVNAGTLILGNSAALGATGVFGNTVASGATLALQGNVNVALGGLTVTGSGVGSNGAIRNLSGSNTLGGQVTLGAGTTLFTSDSGSTLTFTGAIQNSTNALTVGGAGNITASGQFTGAGGITKNGTGTLTLSGSTGNSAAALTVNDGSVLLNKTGGVSALGYGSAIIVGDGVGTAGSALLQLGGNGQLNTSAGSIAVNSDGLFDLNGYAATTSALTGTGTVALGSTGALTVAIASGTTVFGGSITGGGSLTKTGSGTFSLTGTNTYSGATNVNVGTLLIGSSTALSTSSAVTIASGATLDLGNYSATFASLAGTGTVLLSGASNNTLTIGDANDTTLAANIGNTGAGILSFVKQGTGTVTLSGNNTYGGSTTINLGTLKMGLAGYSGGGPLGTTAAGTIVNSGGALDLNGFTLTNAEALSLQGSGAGSGGALTNSSGTAATYSGAVTLAGNTAIGGTGNITLTAGLNDGGVARTLTKVGSGNLLLSATPSSWTASNNVVVNNGTLEVGVTNALGASALSNVTVNANAAGTTATLATSASTTQSILGLTLGGAGGTTTSTNNVAIGSSSTLTLGGNVTYDATGNPLGSTISGGTLGLGSSTRTFTVGDSSTMAGTSVATSELAVSSIISGTGGLTKMGTGTLALTGANTFTGNVAVNAGTLIASNSSGSTGGFAALGVHSGLLSDTTVVSVGPNATLAVSGVTTPVTTNTDTQQYMTMSLNGSGANGAGAINAIGGNSTWRGNVTLAGDTTIQNSAASSNQNLLFFGPYILHSPTYFNLNNHALTLNGTGDIYISSTIGNSGGDTGSITLNGTGTTYFAGERNYYTGDTTVNSGRLELRTKPLNPTLLPDVGILGNLTIGDGVGGANSAVVADYYSDQIANTSNITINSDGLLDLGTYSRADTVGNITLKGGRIDSGTGMLFLNGTLTANNQVISNTATTSTIDGRITFNSNNTVNVIGSNTLTLNAWVANGSFVKDGTGTMVMTNDNYNGGNGYYGTTTVRNGILNIQNSGALGRYNGGDPAAGTVVESGATLQLQNNGSNINVAAEALSINGSGFGGIGALNSKSGTNSWNGAITVGSGATIGQDARIQTDAGSLTIYGSVTGTKSSGQQTLTLAGSGNTTITGPISNGSYGGSLGISKVDSGTATLNGVDTFTGAINVSGGTLDIAAHDVLGAHTNAVNVGAAGTFSVSGGGGNTNTIGSLTGTGTVSIAGSTVLKVNNTSADTFGGTLTGSGLLEKTGAGTFTFNSTATNALAFGNGTIKLTASASTDTLEFQGGSISNVVGIGNLTLTGGTLLLTGATINVGTLNITGNTILDFGTSGASILNANNIYIAAGATLTIVNWTSEVDFLFANSDFRQTNGGGTLAIFNQVGSPPANQVHFQGDPWSPDGSHTTWINSGYDGYSNFEIRPIPEPSTYGAILLAGCIGLLAWKRFRQRPGSPKA